MIHESNNLTLIPNIRSLTVLIHEKKKKKKRHKELEKKCGKNRGFMYKIASTRAVNQPRMLKEVSNECFDIVL